MITVRVEPLNKNRQADPHTEIKSWDELKQAVNSMQPGETLNAKITASLEAHSELLIDGKTVNLYTESDGISIKRTLTSGSNSTDAIFNLTNKAILTIGNHGNKIAYKDDEIRRNNSGLFEVYSGSTLNLSNAEFIGLKNGYSQNDYGKGAIYTSGGTVNLTNVTMTQCKGSTGAFIYISNSTVSMINCDISNNQVWGNSNMGGVIYTSGASTKLTIQSCKISNNGRAEEGAKPIYPVH